MSSLSIMSSGPQQSATSCWSRPEFLEAKSTALKQLQKEEGFGAVKLEVDGKCFTAHLEILCAASEFFDKVIRHDITTNEVVTVHNIDASTFSLLLDFLYTGDLDVTLANLLDVYVAADFLVLAPALVLCRSKLVENFLSHPLSQEVSDLAAEIITRYNDSEVFAHLCNNQDLFGNIGPSVCAEWIYAYASMPISDQSVDWVSWDKITTCEDFPPGEWTISEITFYLIPSWGGTPGLIGGVDVEYRNIWSEERRKFLCDLASRHPAPYEVQSLKLEDSETIRSVEMHSGWLVDSMKFMTSQGRVLGPFGRSKGGGKREIDPATASCALLAASPGSTSGSYFLPSRGNTPTSLA
uniref:BTB domain-containing protein n=1 Tax=Mesocestoides corti TaxID=53468 RepID=A0A5K3EZE3_MESCO